MGMRSKLTAPAFERLARTPWPIASLASSGINPLSSGLGPLMVEEGVPGIPEQRSELGPGIGRAHVDDADGLDARPRGLDVDQMGHLSRLPAQSTVFHRDRTFSRNAEWCGMKAGGSGLA